MKKALIAALCFIVVGFMMVNGTLAATFNEARDIFQDLTEKLGEAFGMAATDSKFDVDLIPVGSVEQLYPGGQATHTVKVKNQGDLNACFRLAFAVQETTTWDKLSFTFSAPADYAVTDWMDITVGGTTYKMKVFTYTGTLAPKAESANIGVTIAMDKEVTSKQIGEYRSDFLKTQVLAIEADLFTTDKDGNQIRTPAQALDLALPLTDFNPFH